MAFDDIFSAITSETDQRIADAKAAHAQRIASMKEESKHRLLRKKEEIEEQRRQKEKAMRAKTETHMSLQRRDAILRKKQELLARCYDGVKSSLVALEPAAVRTLLTHFLDGIKEKGEIRPAKNHRKLVEELAGDRFKIGKETDASGGFVFVSDTREYDYTFENMVEHHLRPLTEVQVSTSLFHS